MVNWTVACAHGLRFGGCGSATLFAFFLACSEGEGSGNGGSGGATAGSGGAAAASGSAGSKGGSSAGGSAGSSGTGNPPDVDAFWSNFAEAVCHRYWHCPREDDEFDRLHGRGSVRERAMPKHLCGDPVRYAVRWARGIVEFQRQCQPEISTGPTSGNPSGC